MTLPPPVITPVAVNRLEIPVPSSLADFQARYENAVPTVELEHIVDVVTRAAPWSETVDYVDRAAPFGFLIYLKTDMNQVMALAGDHNPCVAYLMGNHTIAEQMFRHNPAVMLYAPLRTVLWGDDTGQVWFAVDQPSTVFAGFADPRIGAVGATLDGKLATLLEHLELAVPTTLRPTDVAHSAV